VPESEAARDDESDEKANQKEPAVRGERDQENRYYCDGDDETRRSSQAESSQAESRAAARFRFHEYILAAEKLSVAPDFGWRSASSAAITPPLRLGFSPRGNKLNSPRRYARTLHDGCAPHIPAAGVEFRSAAGRF